MWGLGFVLWLDAVDQSPVECFCLLATWCHMWYTVCTRPGLSVTSHDRLTLLEIGVSVDEPLGALTFALE
jgi:hypothetical protein